MERKKVRKGCLIGLLVFGILCIIAAVLFFVLVFKGINFNKVNIEFDEKDLSSVYEKLNIDNDDNTPSVNDLLFNKFYVSDQPVLVDTTLTNEEITALLDDIASKDDYITNIQINMIEDDLFEMTFNISNVDDLLHEVNKLSPSLGDLDFVSKILDEKEVYYKGTVEYNGENGMELDYEKINVGILPIRFDAANQVIDVLEDVINTGIDNMPALSIETFEITEDGLRFEGTIPDEFDQISQ